MIAVLATAVWSILDRQRENYVKLYKWFRLFHSLFSRRTDV